MAGIDPWSYAEKYKSEHANQAALFMWANMARRFGLVIADDPHSYTVAGFAVKQFENAGKLGYKMASEPVPELKWLHAIHNQGHGDKIRGAQAKAEGVKAGIFDMFLPRPKWKIPGKEILYSGLYLELKVGNNQMSLIQGEFAADMTRAGYACECAWGWLDARLHLMNYLELK